MKTRTSTSTITAATVALAALAALGMGTSMATSNDSTGGTAALAGQDAQEPESAEPETDFVVLFDGSSLDNFRGYAEDTIGEGWTIEGDVLVCNGGGDIITRERYADFDLRFDWRVGDGGNSGVMYRVGLGDDAPYVTGPEYQILDDAGHADGRRAETSAASLYGLYAPDSEVKRLHPPGQWNSSRIVVRGNHVEHYLNGQKVVEAEIDSEDWKTRVAASKFANWPKFATLNAGHIAWQDHGDRVEFRNIRIKSLGDAHSD
jgi:hypothetical protein